jgi:hypothetical protein
MPCFQTQPPAVVARQQCRTEGLGLKFAPHCILVSIPLNATKISKISVFKKPQNLWFVVSLFRLLDTIAHDQHGLSGLAQDVSCCLVLHALHSSFSILTQPCPYLSVLLVLSFASFLPQLQLLWLRRDSSGISLCYVLFNLVVATELFTIDLSILTSAEGGEIFVHSPASTGDWLNLAQFGTVWLMWALMYVNPRCLRPDWTETRLPPLLDGKPLTLLSASLPASCSTLVIDLTLCLRSSLPSTQVTSSSPWCL